MFQCAHMFRFPNFFLLLFHRVTRTNFELNSWKQTIEQPKKKTLRKSYTSLLELASCMYLNDDTDIHEMNKIANNNNNRITSILCNLLTFAIFWFGFSSHFRCVRVRRSFFRLPFFLSNRFAFVFEFAHVFSVRFAPFNHITTSLWMVKFDTVLFQRRSPMPMPEVIATNQGYFAASFHSFCGCESWTKRKQGHFERERNRSISAIHYLLAKEINKQQYTRNANR